MSAAPLDGLLHVRLLGDLQLSRAGAGLPLPASRRTRGLLGYLVATAAPQSRSALCDLLWDGPEDPRASLRWSLTKLRPVTDSETLRRLVADREHVAFQARQCEVDTVLVQRLLRDGTDAATLADLEAAAGVLRGEFLDGLDLPTCYRFHHWCMAQRERYGKLRRSVLEALVARLANDPGRALPYGHAMVAADPLAEAAHAALVRLLAADGRYPEAERHFEWARDLLRREVALASGGPLDEAIRAARRALREGGAATTTVRSAAPALSPGEGEGQHLAPTVSPEVPAAPALLGREAECRAIDRALGGQEPARMLLFTGEPGLGKTRLLDRLAECAAATGRQVIRGRCFEAERVRPYGLWLDALRGVSTAGIAPDALAQAAPLLAGQAVEGGNRERLFDAAAALVSGLAARHPLALLFDDLQWIDEASAALLHFLARTLAGPPRGNAGSPQVSSTPFGGGPGAARPWGHSVALFAGAARAGEIDDNPWARGLLQSLSREGGVLRLPLAPLGADDARALLGNPAIDAADALRQTGGNPLYLLELARATQRGSDASGFSVDALLDERLRALDAAARELLAWAAAMGGELRPELLAAAAGLPLGEALARLERFERFGLLVPARDGHFDFAHDLLRQAVYRTLSQPRRRAVHRQIAHALGPASADDPWLHGEIVRHAGLAGDTLGAARACLAAGEHCLRVFANVQAADVAERGLAHAAELEPGAERVRLEMALLRLRVAAAALPGGRRLPSLAERIERTTLAAEALGLPAEAAAGWELQAYCRQPVDSGRAHDATLAAERLTRRADAATHCQQLANSGRCLLDIEADPARGAAMIDEATALAAELGLKLMEIDWGRGLLARAAGDLEGARQHLAQAVTIATLAQNHWRELECRTWLATVEFERGCFAEVLRHVYDIVAVAVRMGEARAPFAQAPFAQAPFAQAPFAQALGTLVRWRQGDAAAEGHLAAHLDALRELDDKAHLAYALNEAAALLLEQGRFEAAAALATEALTAAQAVRRPTEVAVATACLARAAVDTDRAAACAAECAEWLARPPGPGAPSARAIAAMLQAATPAAALSTLASTPAS